VQLIDLQDKDGESALILAAANGHSACVTALIEAKADVNLPAENGGSALMFAAANGHSPCVTALIEGKASVLIGWV